MMQQTDTAGKTIANVFLSEGLERTRREPRSLGFAKELLGEFSLEEFNAVTPEEMGFGEYMP
jgi:hypothetical protein